MNNSVATLQQLKDIQTPPAISMWPSTWGWYGLLIFLVLLIFIIGFYVYKHYQRKHKQQQVLRMLHEAVLKYPKNSAEAMMDIAELIRRIAIATFDRETVASLQGEEWLQFLDKSMLGKPFSTGVGKVLLSAPYQKKCEVDINELQNLVKNWIKRVT